MTELPIGLWDERLSTAAVERDLLLYNVYAARGAKPAANEFTRTDVADLRGRPVWEIDKWSDRS